MDNSGTGPNSRFAPVTDWFRDIAVAGLFLTRLPFRPKGEVGSGELADAGRVYPLIGLLVGVVAGGTLMLAAELDLHPLACAFIGLAAGALVTGGLHEDGLADVADGFGGGYDRQRKMQIMRDSRIGAFGVLALIFSISIRASIVSGLPGPGMAAVALLAGAVLSRAVLPAVMVFLPLARTDGLAATAGRATAQTMALAFCLGLIITWPLLGFLTAVGAGLAALFAAAVMGMVAQRQIGGYTGDVLGATQQLAEIAVLIIAGAYAL
jgi:adenosylcobinamide-GDP ribazoletransferase